MTFPRNRQDERMDDPALDRTLHEEALAGLRRINLWSRSAEALWHSIRTYLDRHKLSDFRILDLACGSGDVSLALVGHAISAGYQAKLTGCDKSPIAIATARQQAAKRLAQKNNDIQFIELDVLRDPLPPEHEIVMTSLFLHHLDEAPAVRLLERMRDATGDLVLVDDLRRSRLGYWLAWFGSRILSRSPVVHFDAPASVAGAFTTREIQAMAARAGMQKVRITTHWPQRFLLEWKRSA
jgi:SAM-dependent methyltransferase